MITIDTHTHLYDDTDTAAQDEMIRRALDAGVTKMYMPNCDSSTITGMMDIARRYPGNCLPMMGLHPCYVKEHFEAELAIVQQHLQQGGFAAVGEIGLDYYWDRSFDAQQEIAFGQQIDWALQYGLPIVIHSRESNRECIDMVQRKQDGRLKGIFHCFSGTLEQAQEIIELGLYLGIGGVVTYKKSQLPEIIAALGPDHLVLETDAPYLAPVPYRGKRNESSYIPLIAEKVADTLAMPLEELAARTTANAEKIFG
jgi:TatD DNase family protein